MRELVTFLGGEGEEPDAGRRREEMDLVAMARVGSYILFLKQRCPFSLLGHTQLKQIVCIRGDSLAIRQVGGAVYTAHCSICNTDSCALPCSYATEETGSVLQQEPVWVIGPAGYLYSLSSPRPRETQDNDVFQEPHLLHRTSQSVCLWISEHGNKQGKSIIVFPHHCELPWRHVASHCRKQNAGEDSLTLI